jgi:hypothetical protein
MTKSEQARINGARSKGPKTPEGKAASSRNAIKHGFAATENVVISIEDQPAWLLHRDGVRSAFDPKNYVEQELVDKLASISWRQSRLVAIETALIDAQISFQKNDINKYHAGQADDPYFHLLVAWQSLAGVPHNRPAPEEPNMHQNPESPLDINSMELVRRYQVSLDRQYRNALLNLRQYRNDFAAPAIAPAAEAKPIDAPVIPEPPTANKPAEQIEPNSPANPFRSTPLPVASDTATTRQTRPPKLPRAA